jgi:N-methylhydantoinase A/oxoprolinase/acetone carboxylase beta subunit
MELQPDRARRAFEEGPAQALGMSVEEAAMGAVQILTHSMVQSIEENSVRKGFDPRDFALVAEGGAGPLFAAQIAIEVGTPNVVVPPYPGVTAAMGLLATDMVYEYVATSYQRLSSLDAAPLAKRFAELEEEARRARPDAEDAALVDVSDRAPAGADRVDVDHRDHRLVGADLRVQQVLHAQLAALREADVGRRASDVERDDVVVAGLPSRPDAADDACDGPGHEEVHRARRRGLGRGLAARRS